jgi:hypothetical protein
MTGIIHLGDEVEVVTDSFESVGAPRGSIGVVVDDWTDGSNDVEVSDPQSGQVVARIRAAENDIRLHTGPGNEKEPREHGVIFGRGDDLGYPTGDPPAPPGSQFGGLPGGGSRSWAPVELPPADAPFEGDVPWELKDQPPSGPTLI